MAAGTGGGPLDALLGNVFQDDEELELMSGINFKSPLSAIPNPATRRIDVTSVGVGSGDVVGPASATANRIPVFADGTGKRLADSGQTIAQVIAAGAAAAPQGDLKANGSVAMIADLNLGGHKATNAADGAGNTDLTTLQQVTAAINAAFAAAVSTIADWKQSVRLATTTALAASTLVGNVRTANANGALPTIDGVAPAVNDRILDKDHGTGSSRGVYVVTSLGSGGAPWVLTRAADFDVSAEVTAGATVVVTEGTANGPGNANGGNVFMLTTPDPITLGSTSLTFARIGTLLPDGVTVVVSGGVIVRAALTGDVTAAQGSNALTIANNVVSFGKLQDIATDSLIGRDTTGTGDPETIALDAATLAMVTAQTLGVPNQLGARGTENVVVDLYPSTQQQGTVNTGSSITADVAMTSGRRYIITADVQVDDGSGNTQYLKTLQVRAQNRGGTAEILAQVVNVEVFFAGANYTLAASISGTSVRFTLTNTSGTNRPYNLIIGFVALDKP